MAKLLVLLPVVLVLELYLLLAIGNAIGFWPTLGILVGTAMVGGWLAKSEGLRVVRKWQAAMVEGRVPEEGVLGGALALLGGLLLVTPGVLTDVAGLLLLFPPTRRLVAARVQKSVEARIAAGTVRVVSYRVDGMGMGMGVPPRHPRPTGRVIDVEGETVETAPPTPAKLTP